jgi:hypothetical protein
VDRRRARVTGMAEVGQAENGATLLLSKEAGARKGVKVQILSSAPIDNFHQVHF